MAAPEGAPASDYVPGPSQSSTAWPPTNRKADDLVSPPLIAMVAVVGTAFLVVFYVRLLSRHLGRCRRRLMQWRRRHRRYGSSTDLESTGGSGGAPFDYFSSNASSNYFFSPYGLDESAIKTLPLSFFTTKSAKHLFYRECAVCLVEFEENDSLRTLPLCAHAFHVDCIDVWLRSHANCPLCRAAVFRQDSSPFVPMRAARIRPSFDDFFFDPSLPPPPPPPPPPPLPQPPPDPDYSFSEITLDDDRGGGGAVRNFLLKRSYSFGFERNLAADRMVLDGSTASPWRYRHRGGGFWSKRWPSPFGGGGGGSSSRAARVFSFRQVAGKSPFFRRRGFFPLSESGVRFSGGGPSSRRTRSMTSPIVIFSRPQPGASAGSSSRMRSGDPEALLSPDRLGSDHLS